MGQRGASWFQPILLVILLLFLPLVSAELVPFTLRPTTAELEPRGLYQHASRLQPRHEVELHYADGKSGDAS